MKYIYFERNDERHKSGEKHPLWADEKCHLLSYFLIHLILKKEKREEVHKNEERIRTPFYFVFLFMRADNEKNDTITIFTCFLT